MTARDLVSNKFVRIGETHSVAEAIGIVFDAQAAAFRELVIVVLSGEGHYLGMLEPRDILDSFGTSFSAWQEDNTAVLAEIIRRGMQVPIADLVRRDVPALRLGDNLATMISTAALTQAAMLPVFDKGEFVGVVPLTAIFEATCSLTISGDTPFAS